MSSNYNIEPCDVPPPPPPPSFDPWDYCTPVTTTETTSTSQPEPFSDAWVEKMKSKPDSSPWIDSSNRTTPQQSKPQSYWGEHLRIEGSFINKMPVAWRNKARSISIQAWEVAEAIWYVVGMRHTNTVRITSALCKQFLIKRYAKSRGIAALEKAGMITVKRADKKNPVITIVDAPFKDKAGG